MSTENLLKNLYSSSTPELVDKINQLINPDAGEIADAFYRCLREREESARYLSNEIVQTRLRASMTQWLRELFVFRASSEELETYIERQIFIGNRHARINLSFFAMQVGATALKREIFSRVIRSEMSSSELTDTIMFIDELIDISISTMNQAFLKDTISDAKDQQTLTMQSIGFDMALQSESLRASLYDWHRQIIQILFEGGQDKEKIPSIRKTNFGLWVTHKGELLFSGTAEITQLKEIIGDIDDALTEALKHCEDTSTEAFKINISRIEQNIRNASEILGLMTDRSLTLEGGRDQLTRLFNRRFLRTVMLREIKNSLTSGESFAVLLADIDHFKQINDQYGHDAGDLVLQQFSEVVTVAIRAGDFIFRYGGEEFLCVIASIGREFAINVAEKIRQSIEDHPFSIGDGQTIRVTASIGLAIFAGNPDYTDLITQADQALYKAKEGGRNRCVIYGGT